jgi:dephospho-CoA kinase
MLILGLTGSIAMGKSAAARLLKRRGIPVHDSDAAVHAALSPGGAAVAAVTAAFPECRRGDGIDRQILGRLVFDDTPALRRLEAILHPLARRATIRFLAAAARRRCRIVVLDIPLLFEIGADRQVDAVLVVSAPDWLQRARALRRLGMTPEKFASILARQVPDLVKRRRADHVVTTALGFAPTGRGLAATLRALAPRRARRWKPGWR